MKPVLLTGRIFYAIAMIGIAIHQIFYADFCPIFFPRWPSPIAGYHALAYIFSIALIVSNVFIIIGYKAKTTAQLLAAVMLLMLLFGQIPFEYIVIPYKKTHLALWELPLKELALAGGALCIAESFTVKHHIAKYEFFIIKWMNILIPFGPSFFSTTMICFGITHFLYTDTVANMVPSWMSAHYFWTYFAAVALILAGIAIIIKIFLKIAALLLGLMIFLWFAFLHVPGAIEYPLLDQGNLVFSAFSALAFSGIALVIAGNCSSNNQLNEKNSKH